MLVSEGNTSLCDRFWGCDGEAVISGPDVSAPPLGPSTGVQEVGVKAIFFGRTLRWSEEVFPSRVTVDVVPVGCVMEGEDEQLGGMRVSARRLRVETRLKFAYKLIPRRPRSRHVDSVNNLAFEVTAAKIGQKVKDISTSIAGFRAFTASFPSPSFWS